MPKRSEWKEDAFKVKEGDPTKAVCCKCVHTRRKHLFCILATGNFIG